VKAAKAGSNLDSLVPVDRHGTLQTVMAASTPHRWRRF
jgi:hypothetical protein